MRPGDDSDFERAARDGFAPIDSAPDPSWLLRSSADICSEPLPPVEWDIDGILARDDGPVLLFGQPESFKSWIGLHVTQCMVTGAPFLGRFKVNRRPHGAFLNFDASLRSQSRRIALTQCDHERLWVASPDGWDAAEFRKIAQRLERGFIAIDCFADVFQPDPKQDPADAMRAFIRSELRAIFEKHGLNGVVIDHAKRAPGKTNTADYYGSVQKKASFRQMWAIEREVDEANPALCRATVRSEKLSEAEKFLPFSIDLAFTATSVDLTFGGSGIAAVSTSADRLFEKIRDEGPVTRAQVGGEGGRTKTDFYELQSAGRIVKTGTKIGRAELWWTPAQIAERVELGLSLNPVDVEPAKEHSNGAALNRVTHFNPDDPAGATAPATTAFSVSEGVGAKPPEPGSSTQLGSGLFSKGTQLNNPVRPVPPFMPVSTSEPMARDGFTLSTMTCQAGDHRGRLNADGWCKNCSDAEVQASAAEPVS